MKWKNHYISRMKKILSLFLTAIIFACSCSAEDPATPTDPTKPTRKPVIYLTGDSTCAKKTESVRPNTGWGEKFADYITGASVVNKAVGGKSTKTYISGGYWTTVVGSVKEGDYVFIQFGHNDENTTSEDNRGTVAFGDFTTNLERMVSDIKERKGIPVLLTPICRRQFNEDGSVKNTHGDYLVAIKNVSSSKSVLLLDMENKTRVWLGKLGVTDSESRYMYGSDKKDNTHLQTQGAVEVAALVAEAMKECPDKTLAALAK